MYRYATSTNFFLPASRGKAGIEENAGAQFERTIPGRKSHLTGLVVKVGIRAEHHLVALGLAGWRPRD